MHRIHYLSTKAILTIVYFLPIVSVYGQDLTNIVDMPIAPFLKDSGRENYNNTDNRVYISNRKFVYKCLFKKNEIDKYCTVFYNELCRRDKNVPCIDWKFTEQKESRTEGYSIDKLILTVYKSDLGSDLSQGQTVIKYDYYNRSNRIFQGEQTTVTEDSSRIFIHPPRSHAFAITEFCPFPELRFPLSKGKKWAAFIDFPSNFFAKSKVGLNWDKDLYHVDFEYQVGDYKPIPTEIGNILCTEISATGASDLGQTKATYYFNDSYGLVKIIYTSIDKSRLEIELTEILD